MPRRFLTHPGSVISDRPVNGLQYQSINKDDMKIVIISALADVMVIKGVSEHLRSDNGPEFVAKDLQRWLAKTGARTLYIELGSPWENACCESFNSKLRDEFLNGEIFHPMKELRVLAERWRVHYKTIRRHSSPGYRPPASEAWLDKQHGAWRSGNRYALPTSPPPPMVAT